MGNMQKYMKFTKYELWKLYKIQDKNLNCLILFDVFDRFLKQIDSNLFITQRSLLMNRSSYHSFEGCSAVVVRIPHATPLVPPAPAGSTHMAAATTSAPCPCLVLPRHCPVYRVSPLRARLSARRSALVY